MTPRPPSSIADVGDRHRRRTAIAMLAVGCLYAAGAAQHLLPPGAAPLTDGLVVAMAVLIVAALAPTFVWKARNLSRSTLSLYRGKDGVVAEVLGRAQTTSWVVTFLSLVVLETLAERWTHLPAAFFLQAGLAIMLGSFAVVFLILDRDPGEPSPAEDRPRA